MHNLIFPGRIFLFRSKNRLLSGRHWPRRDAGAKAAAIGPGFPGGRLKNLLNNLLNDACAPSEERRAVF